MKKTKLLAVLSAAMLGCCAMGGTAFAEVAEPVDYSKYQLGDITMDGVVDVEDAQLMLQIYADCLAQKKPVERGFITEQQLQLGNIDRKTAVNTIFHIEVEFPIELSEALCVMTYYLDTLTGKSGDLTLEEFAVGFLRLSEE